MDFTFLQGVNWAETTFAVLFVVGAVNVVSFFKTDLTSGQKWGLSVLFAAVANLVPADLGSAIVNQLKEAVEVATAASGAFKLFTTYKDGQNVS